MIDFSGMILLTNPHRMIEFTKTVTPKEILESLEPLKGDDGAVRKYGVDFGVR